MAFRIEILWEEATVRVLRRRRRGLATQDSRGGRTLREVESHLEASGRGKQRLDAIRFVQGKSRYVENDDDRQEGPGGPKWIRIIGKQL